MMGDNALGEHPGLDDAAPRIEVVGGDKDGLLFPVGEDGLLVGRSGTCDIVFDSREVSRRHAYFYTNENGCFVEDLSSTNGLWINGAKHRRQQLHDGDVVDAGPVRFILHEGTGEPLRPPGNAHAENSGSESGMWSASAQEPAQRPLLALAALAFGMLAYLHWAFGAGAGVLGLLALVESRREVGRIGTALAIGGLFMGAVGIGMNVWFKTIAPRLHGEAGIRNVRSGSRPIHWPRAESRDSTGN